MKKLVVVLLLVLMAAGVGAYYFNLHRKAALEIHYREVPVARGNLEVTILATGTVQPENRLEIKPPVAGRVEQVLVKEGQQVRKGQVLAWMSSTERAALIDAARAQGENEVKHWEENYRPTPILAPINGTLILRNVEAGQTFTNADAVFVMSDRLTVTAQVDETDIAQIRLQQKADIVLDAYPNNHFPATVNQIAFDAKTVNNVTTYDVDVLPGTTPDFMRSGMTANVTFMVSSRQNVLLVSNDALRVQGGHYTVLVKSVDGQPVEQVIEAGLTDGKHTEIVNGLPEGQVLLVTELVSGKSAEKSSNPFSPMAPRRTTH
jgi:macrolide-specific efflux system membrane fusion protein